MFWLGTHRPGWLAKTAVPLFVSHRTLSIRKSLPRALGPWALDSGGFSELSMYGEWRTTPQVYAIAEAGIGPRVSYVTWTCDHGPRRPVNQAYVHPPNAAQRMHQTVRSWRRVGAA